MWLGRKRAWRGDCRSEKKGLKGEVRMRRKGMGDIGCVDVVRGVMRVRSCSKTLNKCL